MLFGVIVALRVKSCPTSIVSLVLFNEIPVAKTAAPSTTVTSQSPTAPDGVYACTFIVPGLSAVILPVSYCTLIGKFE